jgi:putative FmdB family regulatory protein
MPLYDYECCKCHKVEERLAAADSRIPEKCSCGYTMRRLPPAPKVGAKGFQPGVILGSGQKVAGSFGVARKKGRGRTE